MPLSQDTGQPQLLFSKPCEQSPCEQRRPSWTTGSSGRHQGCRNQGCRSLEHPEGADPPAPGRIRRQKGCAAAQQGGFMWEELGKRDFPPFLVAEGSSPPARHLPGAGSRARLFPAPREKPPHGSKKLCKPHLATLVQIRMDDIRAPSTFSPCPVRTRLLRR